MRVLLAPELDVELTDDVELEVRELVTELDVELTDDVEAVVAMLEEELC